MKGTVPDLRFRSQRAHSAWPKSRQARSCKLSGAHVSLLSFLSITHRLNLVKG